jgi:hypothetical protein
MLAVAAAVIAWNEYRNPRRIVPKWSAGIGVGVGGASGLLGLVRCSPEHVNSMELGPESDSRGSFPKPIGGESDRDVVQSDRGVKTGCAGAWRSSCRWGSPRRASSSKT